MKAVALLLICAAGAAADDGVALEEARRLLQTGQYESSSEAFEKLVEDESVSAEDQVAAALGLSTAYQHRGLWDAAEDIITRMLIDAPEHPDLLARLGELQFLRGRYEEAAASLEAAMAGDHEHLLARLAAAHLAAEQGRFDDALEGYRWFVRYYNRVQPVDAQTLLLVGEGSLQYARWKSVSPVFNFVVNTLCVDALADDPTCWQASLMSGELLLEKYNSAQAREDLAAALAINPRAAEVIVAQGHSALLDRDLEQAIERAREALSINPALPSALLLAADASLMTGELRSAMTFLEQAHKINPVSQQTLARMAGVFLLDDGVPEREDLEALLQDRDDNATQEPEQSRFASIWRTVVKHHPQPGIFLSDLGEILDGRRKFAAAEVCYRRAIEVMPQLSSPRTSLGMLAMRTGDLDEAQSILDAAFKADPYHVRVSNMRKVLGQLRDYETVTSDHFVIRIPSDQRLLGEAMSEFLEETYDELTALFGFEPETRTQFEVFGPSGGTSAHQWFSARMVGLPWVQTVGASTGMIVAMASPNDSAEPFNWARVVRHEFVHILTLQQTRFNIPHWYTEALAVRTEGVTPPEWDPMLMRRVPAGEVFTLADINAGFQRPEKPEDWQMAYCQSWLYATFIAETYGEQAHANLLEAYRRNLSTEAAIAEACGVQIEDFEAGYARYLSDYVDRLRAERVPPPPSIEAAQAAWREHPTDLEAQAQVAWAMWNGDRRREAVDIAEKLLEKDPQQPLAIAVVSESLLRRGETDRARSLLGTVHQPADPRPEILERLALVETSVQNWKSAADHWQTAHRRWPREPQFLKGLAACLLRQDRQDELRPVLERLATLDADDLLSRKKLALMAEEEQDWESAIAWAVEATQIDITDAAMHRVLLAAFDATGDERRASREQSILEQLGN